MRMMGSLLLIAALAALALAAAQAPPGQVALGVVLPYAALALFVGGMVAKVAGWARSPVPFRIPTTGGQQRSLPWIRRSRFDNPANGREAFVRVLLEVLTFRSLFRNSRAELREGGRVVFGSDKWLWAAAIAFHYSFLIILLRHFRFFFEPVPFWVIWMQNLDGFFQITVPVLFATDAVILGALGFLLARRLLDARLRYISLPADYVPLFLILGIAGSGILLRHVWKIDVVAAKTYATSLVSLHPAIPAGLSPLFFTHVFLVASLFAYLPFSKLVHMAGAFVSPTRNLASSNRTVRHVNPWNPDIVGHTYAEWEEEFHDKIVACGIPLDRETRA